MKQSRIILGLGLILAIVSGGVLPQAAVGRPWGPAAAPATDEAWTEAVQKLAERCAGGDAGAGMSELLSDQHAVRTFDGKAGTIEEVVEATKSAKWVMPLSYRAIPDQLARDMVALVASDDVDAGLRAYLTPPNENAIRAADVTAVKWIGQVLAPRADQPVGVILFFHPADEKTGEPAKLTLLLVSGDRVGTHAYRVRRIAVGQVEVIK
jgi:hypothetical protein